MRMPTWPSVDGAGAAIETSGHHLPFSPQFGKAAWPWKVSSIRRDFPAPLGATMQRPLPGARLLAACGLVGSRRITALVVNRSHAIAGTSPNSLCRLLVASRVTPNWGASRDLLGWNAVFWGALQLATLVDRVPRGERWIHEIKFDGYRAGPTQRPVCTENPIRVDDVTESPKLAE